VQHRTTSKVFRILAAQGLAFADLAKSTGLNVRTLHNVANGSSKSRRARHKIEAALGMKLNWPQGKAVPQNDTGALPQS
jgi:ribosome-binding protein aMBF1 (putative translation factor)